MLYHGLRPLTADRYHDSHLYIIDVSQSVEHDHPRSFDFLRADIGNVNEYFTRRSSGEVRTLGMRRTWDFIVSDTVGLRREDELGDEGETMLLDVVRSRIEDSDGTTDDADSALGDSMDASNRRPPEKRSSATEDAVFKSSFIPRSLAEVYDPERDVDILQAGHGDQLIYARLAGFDLTSTASTNDGRDMGDLPSRLSKSVRFEDEEQEFAEEEEGDADDLEEKRPRGFRHEDREAKKVCYKHAPNFIRLTWHSQVRKQAVKEEKREKRSHKMPKKEKKALVTKGSGR